MVTDYQVRKLMQSLSQGEPLSKAALRAGLDPKTARKYRRADQLPSSLKARHTWRTRPDPFAAVWPEMEAHLRVNPGLQAKSLFDDLQRRYPGRFADGQLRTLQRQLKVWRALEGPPKEVFFAQEHRPGELCASDFCHLSSLGITVQGQPFSHLLYHFVLTYSNWETGSLCFAESFESLSTGLQNALWELGGVPQRHRTDSLSAAVHQLGGQRGSRTGSSKVAGREEFTQRYAGLLRHYHLQGEHIQAGQAHENGDVEQRHHRFKVALDQALMLRGSRDFNSRSEYGEFVRRLLAQLNAGRTSRLREEQAVLRALPVSRLDTRKLMRVRVGPGSTIRVQHNVYSVHSRLIGEWVEVRVGADELELWYAQRLLERLPRLRGEGRHRITYRHVIDWLVRKPGAFANYRYREDLFPSSHFRVAYDALLAQCPHSPRRAERQYLALLHLAATQSEQKVEAALRWMHVQGQPLTVERVQELVGVGQDVPCLNDILIAPVNLLLYDELYTGLSALPWCQPPLDELPALCTATPQAQAVSTWME